MSILNVEHLSHGFGDRAIFEDVSFRLLRGEHIGLVGANGEGKSTFMSIVTGKRQPDEGKVEWSKNVRSGYLDQHTVLEPGMTVRDVLQSAFAYLFEMEATMNEICEKLGEAGEDEMDALLDLWINTVYKDQKVQGSESGPVVYFRNCTGSPLVWGVEKSSLLFKLVLLLFSRSVVSNSL